MIIYDHEYKMGRNEIFITPVVVRETPKTYISKGYDLCYSRRSIRKEEMNKLINYFGLYMVSENPSEEIFRQKVMNYFESKHIDAKAQAEHWAYLLDMVSKVPCTILPQEGSGNE